MEIAKWELPNTKEEWKKKLKEKKSYKVTHESWFVKIEQVSPSNKVSTNGPTVIFATTSRFLSVNDR